MGRHSAAPTARRVPVARWARAYGGPVAGGVAVSALVVALVQLDPTTSTPAFAAASGATSDRVQTTVSAPTDATWGASEADTTWLTDAMAAEAAERARLAAEAEEAARQARVQAEQEAARSAARAARSAAKSASVPSSTPVGDVKLFAASLVGDGQFGCLDALWQRESGWNPTATNRSSGAYGIPQSLPASKMASAGADWRTNPLTQVRWGVSYIHGRYGSPCAAWQHSQATGWY